MFRLASSKAEAMPAVDFRANLWDAQVQRMTEHGFSAKLIQEHTGLTMSQVSYRMVKTGGVRQFRDGRSDKAKQVIHQLDRLLHQCKSLQRRTADFRVRTRQQRHGREYAGRG